MAAKARRAPRGRGVVFGSEIMKKVKSMRLPEASWWSRTSGRWPELEDAAGAQRDPAPEEGEAHVGAEGAVGDGEAEGENPEEEDAALAPLRRASTRRRG